MRGAVRTVRTQVCVRVQVHVRTHVHVCKCMRAHNPQFPLDGLTPTQSPSRPAATASIGWSTAQGKATAHRPSTLSRRHAVSCAGRRCVLRAPSRNRRVPHAGSVLVLGSVSSDWMTRRDLDERRLVARADLCWLSGSMALSCDLWHDAAVHFTSFQRRKSRGCRSTGQLS